MIPKKPIWNYNSINLESLILVLLAAALFMSKCPSVIHILVGSKRSNHVLILWRSNPYKLQQRTTILIPLILTIAQKLLSLLTYVLGLWLCVWKLFLEMNKQNQRWEIESRIYHSETQSSQKICLQRNRIGEWIFSWQIAQRSPAAFTWK